jgi:hypothetical protein
MASSPARVVGDQAPMALPADLPAHLTASLVAALDEGDLIATSSLAAALAAVPDARRRRGRRHELPGVLAIAACACLTGARSYVAISEWAAAQGHAVLDCLDEQPCRRQLPCEATLRRCLQTTDPAALDAAVAGWAVGQLTAQQARAAGANVDRVLTDPGRRVLAIDGKTLRGSAPRATPEQRTTAAQGGGRTHLVAGYDHASGVTLGQVACAAEAGKGGEVAAAKELVAALDDRGLLTDAVLTADAGFTARELAADLRARGAHWILRIKGNQKTLHNRLKALPWSQVPEAARIRSVGHGRVPDPHHPRHRPDRQHRRARRVLSARPPGTQDRPPSAHPARTLERADRLRHHQPRRPLRRSGAAGLLGAWTLEHRDRPALGP